MKMIVAIIKPSRLDAVLDAVTEALAASVFSALAASATIGTSTRTILLICEASISRWIFFDPGEKASMRPVQRSSNRAPRQIIRSQSCMTLLAS